MAQYSVMQCSICRRIKDVLKDQKHATPNECIITKGCNGFLFSIGETTILTPTPSVAGLTDWYPRGKKPEIVAASPSINKTINMSCSATGILTMALYLPGTYLNPPPSTVLATFSQQLTQDIKYSEFVFKVASANTIISGQDSTGKNLRFSTDSVSKGLVFVLVNGVASFPESTINGWTASTANRITFNNVLQPGTIVTISVYTQPPTFTISLKFSLNQGITVTKNSGAWSNIRVIDELTGGVQDNRWWIYSCSGTDILSKSSRLSLLAVYSNNSLTLDPYNNVLLFPDTSTPSDFSSIRFLLASPPYDNTDRYLNFYISGDVIGNDYALLTTTSTITELFAESSALIEIYPPFLLTADPISPGLSSYVTPDLYPSNDSVSNTTPESLLVGTKILGTNIMLASQIIPSFYLIEIEGVALEAVIPGDFGIQKISIASGDFKNDLTAMSVLEDVMINLTANIDLDRDTVMEEVDYNPEFFPMLSLDEEIDSETGTMTDEEFDDDVEATLNIDGEMTISLTRDFDPIGDFVESRWTIRSPEFLIRGKIAVNPERYMQEKANDLSNYKILSLAVH